MFYWFGASTNSEMTIVDYIYTFNFL